ncbi:siderophore ABC transporter substrate-binding protein [Brevibacterium yomogidense]|uniref:Petrobactin ABC transporter, periplasmic binding protein n=1 Tax=Brevibacterium yomogidense TaxID=946573 RepID=A0A1X6WW55_9MICO|nr:ABC transporter substrate-binding protein [Brevibacterium yomogidense]SLM88666.1 Petrobactin ABC transporter, periplasmic binding protein [Brevibacterium yomogidense]
MHRPNVRLTAVIASTAALALGLTACGSGDAGGASAEAASGESETVTIEANGGSVDVPSPAQSVVALDNRTFKLLDDWGVELSGGAVSLMRADLSYKDDESILDIGSHREPNLENIVAAEPDLIISGQRFAQYDADIADLAEAPIVNLDPREGEDFGDELKRQVTTLGEVFDKQDEAQALVDDYDAAVERVSAAYDADETVMSVITSGGDINYAAPTAGRTLGPVYDSLGLTPSLEVDDASSGDQGDDISVEAIADSNPDWILVMDRDAGVSANSGEEYTPAQDLIADSAALQNVTAVEEENIVYMPEYTYLDESLQTYTEFYESVADAMEQGN